MLLNMLYHRIGSSFYDALFLFLGRPLPVASLVFTLATTSARPTVLASLVLYILQVFLSGKAIFGT
jgi:hypothetical protein